METKENTIKNVFFEGLQAYIESDRKKPLSTGCGVCGGKWTTPTLSLKNGPDSDSNNAALLVKWTNPTPGILTNPTPTLSFKNGPDSDCTTPTPQPWLFTESESKQSFQEQKLTNTELSSTYRSGYDMIFWITVGASQLAGIACVALVAYWCTLYGEFAWSSDANQQFYFHPLLMILGLIFFYGDAILIYRVFHFLPKWILKWIHAALHLTALIMSSVGLAAVFENHRRTNKPDMYSIHSWVGITTFGFFCLQYVASFVTFLFPGLPPTVRAIMMPFHTFFGLGIFALAVASALMGITERLMFDGGYWDLKEKAMIGNCLGLCIVIFAFLVVFTATRNNYKRPPLRSESVSPTN